MRYGKIVDGKLIKYSGRKIHTESGKTIINPTEAQLLENGYKPLDDDGNIIEEVKDNE